MVVETVFALLCDCTSLAEFQLKCAMQTSFAIGSKPLPRGMALQLLEWLRDSMAGYRYVSWGTWNMPVIGNKTKVDEKRLRRLLANMAMLAAATPAFSSLGREEAKGICELLEAWARSEKSKQPSHPEDAEALASALRKLKGVATEEEKREEKA